MWSTWGFESGEHPLGRPWIEALCLITVRAPLGLWWVSPLRAGSRLQLPSLTLAPELCHMARLMPPLPPVVGRNAAGKDGKERLGGSVLEQIPFLQNCEDEDSDEDDELDSVQHKKQRVKVHVRRRKRSSLLQGDPPALCTRNRVPLWMLRAPSVGCVG